MASFGLIKGLAQDLGYNDRINDLRYNERANQLAAHDAEMQAKMFADSLDYKTAMNPYDSRIISENGRKKILEIADFTKNNPSWKYDPMLRVEVNNKRKSLVDNDDLKRGLLVDQNYQEYLKDRQEALKSPNQWDMELLDKQGEAFQNYFKTGHPAGIDEFNKNGGPQPAIYTRPKMFVNLDEVGLKTGNSLKDFEVQKGSNIGEYWTVPKPQQVKALTDSFYMENKRQLDKEAVRRGEKDGYELGKKLVESGFNKHYSIGDANAAWERGMREKELRAKQAKDNPGPSYTPFDNFIDPKVPAGQNTPDLFRKVYGDKPSIMVVGTNGKKADLTGLDMNYDGRYVKRNGVPMLLGYVKVPLEVALQKGIISGDKEDIESGNFSDDGARITSDFLGKAAFEKTNDLDGKGKSYVKVSYQMPINPNDQTARQMFNVYADVDKLVPASTDPYAKPQKKVAPAGAQVDSEGNVFDASGKYIGKRDEF